MTVTSLQEGLIAHEAIGHQLLAAGSVDRPAFLADQDAISRAFRQALRTFPAGADAALVNDANRAWPASLTKAGLWGDEVTTFHGLHQELQQSLRSTAWPARFTTATWP